MRNKTLLFLILFLFAFSSNSSAQKNLYVFKETKNAYTENTRSTDGKPGKNYWQNSSDYTIKVSIDAEKALLKGEEKIVYYNNSNDSLNIIVIRLYQDLFKHGVGRKSEIDPIDITEGVNISYLKVNQTELNTQEKNSSVIRKGTIMYIKLKEKLAPKKELILHINWDFSIPKKTQIRMGTYGSTNYFLGQWYPQVAVYDDVYGWDTKSYDGLAEFYNDFSNFDVEITVPDNFMVWATGEPLNLVDVLQPNYYNKYMKASISDDIIHVITQEDLKKGNVRTKKNIWKYKASNVSDFAFGISQEYVWDVTSVVVDKKTKRRTIVGAAYDINAKDFDKVAMISKETIKSLSNDMPGIPYPFSYFTVYLGDFGMEYPMIANVGEFNNYGMTVYANSHEITHGFFPFYVGTNETRNGWLDESLAVFIPEDIQKRLEPSKDVATRTTSLISSNSGFSITPSIITPTYYLDEAIYFYLNYGVAEQALRILEIHLGKPLFKECLQTFIERWKYKHPTPYDFFLTFNDVSKQNLNWFWNAWYFQYGGIPDLALASVNNKNNSIDVTVINNGDLPLPVVVSFYNNKKLVKTITKPASEWQNNKEIKLRFKATEKITNVILGSSQIPDSKPNDNKFSF